MARENVVCYPCFCLWRGFLQITRMTLFRRTILQLSQSRLTDARTFMVFYVVEFDGLKKNLREVRRPLFGTPTILEEWKTTKNARRCWFHGLLRRWHHACAPTLEFSGTEENRDLRGHVKTSGASFVIKIVCSK